MWLTQQQGNRDDVHKVLKSSCLCIRSIVLVEFLADQYGHAGGDRQHKRDVAAPVITCQHEALRIDSKLLHNLQDSMEYNDYASAALQPLVNTHVVTFAPNSDWCKLSNRVLAVPREVLGMASKHPWVVQMEGLRS